MIKFPVVIKLLFNMIFVLFIMVPTTNGQGYSNEELNAIDSLKSMINKSNDSDTNLVRAHLSLGDLYFYEQPDSAFTTWLLASDLAASLIASTPNDLIKSSTKLMLGEIYNNLGVIYHNKGAIERSFDFYFRSLRIREEINDSIGIASSLNNIGFIFDLQEDTKNALIYYERCLQIVEALNEPYGTANVLNNIGFLHDKLNQKDKAFEYYKRSLELHETLEDSIGIATCLNNIGFIYFDKKQYNKAEEHFQASLKIEKDINNLDGLATSLSNLGNIQFAKGNLIEAKKLANQALTIAIENNITFRIRDNSKFYWEIEKKLGNYQKAFEMYQLYIIMSDSINSEDNQNASIRQLSSYEFEKEQLLKEQKESESLILFLESKRRRNNLQNTVVLFIILLIFGIVLSKGIMKAPPKIAQGFVFFAFLLLFEFMLVLFDPLVDNLTSGAPGWKLLINSTLAGLILPAHAWLEKYLIRRFAKRRKSRKS